MANFSRMNRNAAMLVLAAGLSLQCQMVFAEPDEDSTVNAVEQNETPAADANAPEIKPAEPDEPSSADPGDTTNSENAERAVVINTQTTDDQPAASASEQQTQAQADTRSESTDGDNRARIFKGGKVSLRQKVAVNKATLSDANRQQGEVFLASNKANQNVVTLPSGVQYKILKASKGKNPTEASMVLCRYQGTLIDGTTFDQSDARQPVTLNVAGLLPGLKEAIKLMSSGSKWQIVIPPQLAYGERGDRGVGPNAVLIYDMEILATN